jgi:small membrane protein
MISIFQLGAIATIALTTFYFMILQKRSAVRRIFTGAFFALLAFCILSPDSTTIVANALGIHRGVDLILYVSIFFLLVVAFQLQIRLNTADARTTVLVRELACRSPLQTPVRHSGEQMR